MEIEFIDLRFDSDSSDEELPLHIPKLSIGKRPHMSTEWAPAKRQRTDYKVSASNTEYNFSRLPDDSMFLVRELVPFAPLEVVCRGWSQLQPARQPTTRWLTMLLDPLRDMLPEVECAIQLLAKSPAERMLKLLDDDASYLLDEAMADLQARTQEESNAQFQTLAKQHQVWAEAKGLTVAASTPPAIQLAPDSRDCLDKALRNIGEGDSLLEQTAQALLQKSVRLVVKWLIEECKDTLQDLTEGSKHHKMMQLLIDCLLHLLPVSCIESIPRSALATIYLPSYPYRKAGQQPFTVVEIMREVIRRMARVLPDRMSPLKDLVVNCLTANKINNLSRQTCNLCHLPDLAKFRRVNDKWLPITPKQANAIRRRRDALNELQTFCEEIKQ